jgi:outer membrane protein
MIQTLKTIRLVVALLALSVSFVSASEPQAEKASEAAIAVRGLHDSVSLAIQNNPELAAAKAEYKARHRSQFISFSTMLPQVTAYATGYYHKTGEDDPGETWNENEDDAYGLRVTYDVFTSGKNLNAFRSARADVRAQRYSRQSTEQNVLLEAITAHLDVLRDQNVLAVNEKNLEVLQKQLEAVRDRFEVGVVTRTDVAQSEARFAGARSQLIAAQTDLRASYAGYLRVVGVEAENLINDGVIPQLPDSVEDAISIARSESPILNAAREGARGAQLTAYSEIGSALPQVSVVGTYARYDNKTPVPGLQREEGVAYDVSATVTVPIFTGGRNIAKVSAARYAADALAQSVHATSSSVDENVVVAWHSYLSASAVIAARQEQIKAFEIALEGVRQENSLGTRTTLDVLDAEQDLLDARVNLITAERNQFVAAYGLLASIGRLQASFVPAGNIVD